MHVISLPMIFIFLSYERKEASVGVTIVASSTAGTVVFFKKRNSTKSWWFLRPSNFKVGSGPVIWRLISHCYCGATTWVTPLEFCVHGKWTRMVDVPHVGEWKYSFRYRGARKPRGIVSLLIGSQKIVSLPIYYYFLFLMNASVSTLTRRVPNTAHVGCPTHQRKEWDMNSVVEPR